MFILSIKKNWLKQHVHVIMKLENTSVQIEKISEM